MSRIAAFGEAVRKRRKRLGLSQEALGFVSGLDRTYVSGIERGVRNPTLQSIWRLAEALSTTPSAHLPQRFRLGADLNAGDTTTYYGGGAKGYTDYPSLEQERGEVPMPCVDERWR